MTAIVTIPIDINILIAMMVSLSSVFIFTFGMAFLLVGTGYHNYKYIAFGIILLGIFVIEMLWMAGIIGFKPV